MSNPSKKKGTAAETRVVKYLKEKGLDAERLALHGSKDEGDVRFYNQWLDEFRLEIKAGKQTENPNRKLFEEWVGQTMIEQMNSGIKTFLVIARFNRQVKDYDVYEIDNKDSVMHMYLDKFIEDFI